MEAGGGGGGEEGRAEAERLEHFLCLIRSSCSCDRRQNENKWPLSSTRRAALQIIFLQNPHDPPEGLCGAGGGVANIDPNADNIDTDAGIGIDRYHRNVMETIHTHTHTDTCMHMCTNVHIQTYTYTSSIYAHVFHFILSLELILTTQKFKQKTN